MTLAKGALGGPKIALSIDQCQHIVNTYRRKCYAIKQGWDRSKDFIEHMANPDLEPLQYKCLEIGFEYIRLPNGMCLKYPDLRMAKGEHHLTLPNALGGAVVKVKVEQPYQVIAVRVVGNQAFASGVDAQVVPNSSAAAVASLKQP